MVQALDGPDERLGRHAADIDAGAADGAMADQRDVGAFLGGCDGGGEPRRSRADHRKIVPANRFPARIAAMGHVRALRSEEHTSELQSLMRISYAVFCLKKKKTIYNKNQMNMQYAEHTQ